MLTANAAWTFTERVDDFLDLASQIARLRLARSGLDVQASFHWSLGQAMSGSISPVDEEDLRSFLTAWRPLVMRDEPTHIRTVLALSSHHLTIERLRELSEFVGARLGAINANDYLGRPRMTFSGPKPGQIGADEYSPWEVADLVMHGLIFHRKDRAKRKILSDLASQDPGIRTMLDLIFRQYVIDIVDVMDSARTILAKAKEKAAISDDPVFWGPSNITLPLDQHGPLRL